ncbi:MAG: PRC-barrel domain-containing protein [Candidatus Dormibacteraeota bacterium]|nr:PRC-barrel domain-containing protein [Candidatus Dormibacteraeota bacterium]
MAEQQVAWTDTPYRAPVLDRNGQQIGTTESLLGDEGEDIFHGIAISGPRHRRLVVVPAAHVVRITTEHVETDLDAAGVEALDPYQEEQWFHLGWGGLFRKRPEWRQGE